MIFLDQATAKAHLDVSFATFLAINQISYRLKCFASFSFETEMKLRFNERIILLKVCTGIVQQSYFKLVS